MRHNSLTMLSAVVALSLLASACAPAATPTAAPEPQVLRLATTTSTADSGLLDAILPDFEQKYNARVDVVAVGTGQALEIGAKGDADVVLVHARSREDKFVTDGDGVNRRDVMYNDYILVGPAADPAGALGAATAKAALAKIAEAQAIFVSRGDDSGTHTKEKSLWASAAITPTAEAGWYQSIGQGMGETLLFANEKPGYTLTDRGTWLSMKDKLPNLAVVVGGESINDNKDKALYNPYGVIPVNPEKHAGVNFELATQFAEWITSAEVQQKIGEYGQDKYGQALFYASASD
jgi:tungstate transport system substrate-binding protein